MITLQSIVLLFFPGIYYCFSELYVNSRMMQSKGILGNENDGCFAIDQWFASSIY